MKPTLQLQIGTHRFKVGVEEDAKPAMLAAAKKVERMLSDMRNSSVADGERAAIMVALQLANEEHEGVIQLSGEGVEQLEVVLDETLSSLS